MLLRLCYATLIVAVVSWPHAALGQPVEEILAQAYHAFEEARFDEAAQLLRQAVRKDRKNAEAHYLLARIYLETPLKNNFHAKEAIKKAMALEPDEVRYLEFRLRQYREDSTNIAAYPEQLAIRKSLAKSILKLDPHHPLALIEMGRIALDDYEWQVYGTVAFRDKNYWRRKKENAYAQAEESLWRALEIVPEAMEAYRLLMKLYALEEAYPEALEMLDWMQTHRPEDPYTWLYLGLIHHNLGHAPEATRSFEQALLRMDSELKAVFTDLSFVLNKEETRTYAQDPGDYTQTFWATRDARLLTPENERHNEHFARLVYADLFFGHPKSGVKGWHTERGNIFLRYGKPRNFPRSMGRYGGFLIETFFSRMPVTTSRMVTWDYGDFALQFEDVYRNAEYIYFDESEILARTTRRDVPERYEHQEPGRRVAFPYLASAFKGPAGQADLYIPYGIPVESYDPAGPPLDLTLRTGAFLIHPTGEITSHRRTEFGLSTSQITPFLENDLWIGLHALTTAPGPYDLSVEFETEDREALGYQRDPLFVPDFSADSLMLSDVLLAYGVEERDAAAEPGHVVRGGLSIRPAPWGVFATEQPIYFYFEVYNLARNTADGTTAYEVEAALTPWDDAEGLKKLLRGIFGQKKKEGVSLSFATTGTAQDDGQYLILDVQDQPPGRYVLALRVRDRVTGAWVEASREIFLE